MSLTQSSTGQYPLTYDKYFMMLQNACIRYDKSLKHKPSPTSRAVYQHIIADDDPFIPDDDDEYLEDDYVPDGIDTHSDVMYDVHCTNFKWPLHVKSLIGTLMGNLNPTRVHLLNLGIMDQSISPSIFTICSVLGDVVATRADIQTDS